MLDFILRHLGLCRFPKYIYGVVLIAEKELVEVTETFRTEESAHKFAGELNYGYLPKEEWDSVADKKMKYYVTTFTFSE